MLTFEILHDHLKMDENLLHQISQFFSVLCNPSADQQSIASTADFLLNFYAQPNSFEILLKYFFAVNEQAYQNCAIIGLDACLKKNQNLCQNVEVFNSLLNLSIYPNSNFARRHAIFYISKIISADSTGVIFQFVQFHSSTTNDIELEAIMKLLTLLTKVSGDDIKPMADFCLMLNSKAFNSTNIDTITSAAIFRNKIAAVFNEDEDNLNEKFIEPSLQVLSNVIQNGDGFHTDELVDSFAELVSHCNFECAPLYSLLTHFFSMPDMPINISEQLLFLADSILAEQQIALSELPILLNFLNFYVIHSQRTYSPSNSYELSNNLIFYGFFRWLNEDDVILNIFQNVLPQLFNSSSSGRFTALLIMESAIFFSPNFFTDKIQDYYNCFTNFLQDQDFCVRSTASHLISQFCQAFRPSSVNFELSITNLINCFMANHSVEFLIALSEVFETMPQTDSIFDNCCSFFFQVLNSNDILFQQKVIFCISSLVRRSRDRVSFFFDQIYPAMTQILSLNEESLASPAIACLSHMCKSCTQQMSAFIPNFLQIIMSIFDNMAVQYECINGFSTLCEVYTDECQQYVVTFLKKLFEVANNEVDIEGEFFDEQDNKDDTVADEESDDEFAFQKSISANAAAVRAICKIFYIYPQLLVQHIGGLFEILDKYKSHISGDGTLACAKGTVYISKALVKLPAAQDMAQNLLDNIISTLIVSGSDSESFGNALLALSILIKKYDIKLEAKIIEFIDLSLTGSLFFQREQLVYNKIHFKGLLRIFTSLIKSKSILNKYQSLITNCLPKFQSLLESQNNYFRDLAIELFAAFCSENQTPIDTKNGILQMALTMTNGYASIDCINKFAKSLPELVVTAIPQILEIINHCFLESDQIVTEKCVVLCGVLLRNYQTDISAFSQYILNLTPPSILVKKTNKFIHLLQWIASHQNGELNSQIAATIIKLFSESDRMLHKRRLSNELLDSMKRIIYAIMPTIPNFDDFCSQTCNGNSVKLTNFRSRMQ